MPNSNLTLTASNIRYLLAIHILSEGDSNVRSSNIADVLGISKPSVHGMMDTLQSMNLIQKAEYNRIRLTPLGKEIAALYQQYYTEIYSMLDELLTDKNEIDGAVYALLAVISTESLSMLCKKREKMKASV